MRLKYFISYTYIDSIGNCHYSSCFTQWHPFEWLNKYYTWLLKNVGSTGENPVIIWYKELTEGEAELADNSSTPVAIIDATIQG